MLFNIYTALTSQFANITTELYGKAVHEDGKIWLCIDSQYYPHLLISHESSETINDLKLRAIDVEFNRQCEIVLDESKEPHLGFFTLVRLNDDDPDLVKAFLTLLEESLCRDVARLSSKKIREIILNLSEVFSQMLEAKGDVVGLWGELHFISRTKDLELAVKCWCNSKYAKYDFVHPNFAVEVKTTTGNYRKHKFSYEQLRPEEEFKVYIASIRLVESSMGVTVNELAECLLAKISDPQLKHSFYAMCISKGGDGFLRSQIRLDLLPQETSMIVVQASEVPVPLIDKDQPIDEVSFRVDFSRLPFISEHNESEASSLL